MEDKLPCEQCPYEMQCGPTDECRLTNEQIEYYFKNKCLTCAHSELRTKIIYRPLTADSTCVGTIERNTVDVLTCTIPGGQCKWE